MADVVGHAKVVWSLRASLGLFSIATVGEFVALSGWYVFYAAHPPIASSFYYAKDPLVTWLRAAPVHHPSSTLALERAGDFLQSAHLLLAIVVLWIGFIVERVVVVYWLDLPKLVFAPGGYLRPRWLVIGGVTVAEILVWLAWIWLAEGGEPAFAAAVLALGIHVMHAYEVAVIKPCSFPAALRDPGVIAITALEAGGGAWALSMATRGRVLYPLATMFGALLMEHLLQVYGLTKGAEHS